MEGEHGPEREQQKYLLFWERKSSVAESHPSCNTIALKMVLKLEVNMSHLEQSNLKELPGLTGSGILL